MKRFTPKYSFIPGDYICLKQPLDTGNKIYSNTYSWKVISYRDDGQIILEASTTGELASLHEMGTIFSNVEITSRPPKNGLIPKDESDLYKEDIKDMFKKLKEEGAPDHLFLAFKKAFYEAYQKGLKDGVNKYLKEEYENNKFIEDESGSMSVSGIRAHGVSTTSVKTSMYTSNLPF